MTRLTKDMRDTIARAATSVAFKERKEAHRKAENALALELYNSLFDSAVQKAVAKVPNNWFRQDDCLRFNCNGYDLMFRAENPLPVPYSAYCSRLGNVTGELGDRAKDHATVAEKLGSDERDAYRKVKVMLDSVSTFAQLEKAWPEGRPFYEKYITSRKGSNLPAVQIAEINEMLGLKEAA